MVPRARRPTRPARERASLHPLRRGTGEERGKGGDREVGTWRVCGRARALRVRVRGALPPRAARRRAGGGPPQGVEESEKRGWTERGRVGRAAPRLPHRTRPVCLSRASSPGGWGSTPSPRGDPRPPPRRVTRDRRGDLPARLSRPTSPPRPSRFGSEGSGGGGGAEPPPPRAPPSPAPVTPPRSRPLPRAEPPVRLGMGGVAAAAPPPWWGAGRSPAPSPSRRRPWTGSFPVVGPLLRALRPLAVRLGLSSDPGGLSLLRPSSVWLSLFPALPPPPPCAPCPLVPPLPVGASLTALGGEKGARDAGAGQGPRVGGGGLGCRRKEGRARARAGEASARLRGHGGGLVGRWPWLPRVAVGPAPGWGPASRAGSAEAPRVLRAAVGGERVGRLPGRRRRAWGAPSVPPHPPRPPPPLQVPSASRRGGLKTHGGVARPPWGRGGRARGESGGPLPSPPDSAFPPPPPRGRGTAPRATGPLCRGRREGPTRRPWCGLGPCAA